ncbi:MAG: hypothetical protein J5486_10300 [Bacteroidaceae bacterium]|nr:hypothetical protein [Bacteroidaceae bacterium]
MKQKLTLFVSMLVVCASVFAQEWTRPAAPQAMPLTAGEECYLYNVGAAGFYMGAYDWSTRACVKPLRGYKVYIEQIVPEGGTWDGQSYYLTSYIEDGSPAGKIMCMFLDAWNSIWVDRNKTDEVDKAFTFEAVGDGTYRIGLSPLNATMTPAAYYNSYIGVIPSMYDTRLYLANVDTYPEAQLIWQFVSPANYEKYLADMKQYEAAVALGAVIDDAEARFPNVDIAAFKAVYTNHSSTPEQLQTALAGLVDTLKGYATPDNPVDVTTAIANPSYNDNNNTGWSGTAPGFQNYGNAEFYNCNYNYYQRLTNLTPGVYSIGVRGYYRAGSAANDAAEYTALQEEQPANQNAQLYASYSTSQDMMSLYAALPFASTGATAEALGGNTSENEYGFIPNDMRTAAQYFDAGQYGPTTIVSYTTDGNLTLGLKKESTIDGDWTLFDQWELKYLGNSDAAMQYFKETRLAANTDFAALIDDGGDDLPYGRAAFETYTSALQAFKAATTAADITAALAAYETACKDMQDNLNAYAAYKALYNEADLFLEDNGDKLMGDAINSLEAYLYDENGPSETHAHGGALYILYNGNLTTDEIVAETAYLQALKEKALAEGMVDGMDCTDLIVNPHFATTEGWVKEGLPEFPVGPDNYKMGQAYTIVFGISQEITGLQNGLYELTLNDFYRPADFSNTANYTDNYRAYVYMNDFRAKLNYINDGATFEAVDGNNFVLEGVGYIPNTLEDAATSFQAGRYQQTLYGLVTDGTMKIGVRNDLRYEGCWAVWSDMRLTFRAKNPEVLSTVIENTLPTAQEMLSDKCGTEELNALSAAITTAEGAGDDERYDAMVALKQAMDAASACTANYALLATSIDNLYEAINNYPNAKDIEAAQALLDEANKAYANGTYNNETVEAKIEEINSMTVSIKLGDSTGGEEQDMSDLIVNRNFDPSKGSKDEGRIDGWTTTAMNGYKQYTVSYNRAGFELYQDLSGLPKGKYKVTVHTYYRAGYWNEEEQYMSNGTETHLTTLYAETSANKAEKPVMNLTEGAVAASDAPQGVNTYTLSNGLVAPDGTTPTAAFFAAGYYLNELEFTVPEDGKVRIGLSKKETFPNDYEVVGEWSLYYYGDPEAEVREDYTSLIVNPTFDPSRGSKDEGRIDGWTTTAMNGYKQYTVSYNRAGFELYQDLSGLPEGHYEVTVHTYYRAGYWNEEEQYMSNGTETHLTTLYAETSADKAEKPVMNLTEGAVAASDAPQGVNTYTLSNGLVAPDGTTPTAAFFDAGYYLNSLEFDVPADGKVRIGLSKKETFPNDYEVVGAWHLYYLGKGNVDNAVTSVTTTTAAPAAIYTLNGTRTNALRRGINIVRMPDGTVRKVMVR